MFRHRRDYVDRIFLDARTTEGLASTAAIDQPALIGS
jgi:hypothetical protein